LLVCQNRKQAWRWLLVLLLLSWQPRSFQRLVLRLVWLLQRVQQLSLHRQTRPRSHHQRRTLRWILLRCRQQAVLGPHLQLYLRQVIERYAGRF
jgi:hypothetical protein